MNRVLRAAYAATVVLAGALHPIPAAAADFEMKIGLTAPVNPHHYSYMPWVVLEQELEARTGGRLEVEIFPGGQLGDLGSLVQQVRQGVIEAAMVSEGSLATTYPPIQVFGLPYLFQNREIAWHVLDGPLAQEMIEDMAAETGIRAYAWMENGGFRHFSNNVRQIRSPADMQGLKIRVPEIPLAMEMVRNLGATPTPIPWAELYTSLQTGVADGQENPIATFLRPKLEEVQSHIVLDGHTYGTMALIMNEDWYQSLPDDIKQAFEQSKPLVQAAVRGLILASEVDGLKYLAEKGVEVYSPTEAERAQFRELTQEPAVAWLSERIGSEWVDRMIEEVAQAEQELGLGG